MGGQSTSILNIILKGGQCDSDSDYRLQISNTLVGYNTSTLSYGWLPHHQIPLLNSYFYFYLEVTTPPLSFCLENVIEPLLNKLFLHVQLVNTPTINPPFSG